MWEGGARVGKSPLPLWQHFGMNRRGKLILIGAFFLSFLLKCSVHQLHDESHLVRDGAAIHKWHVLILYCLVNRPNISRFLYYRA